MRVKWVGAALAVMAAAALAPLSGAVARSTSDDFADAGVLGLPDQVFGNTTGNTLEAGEQQPCGSIGATAWFRLETEPGSPVTVSTYGSGFDTVLAVYQGTSPADLAVVGCNDDVGGGGYSAVTFHPGPGVYWVQAGGFAGKTGYLELSTRRSPANDTVGGALDASNGFDGIVDTTDAGRDSDEPDDCAGYMYGSVWYRVDTPVETEVAVVLDNGRTEWSIALFEQRPDGSLDHLACDYGYEDGGPVALQVRAPARPGTPILVKVASWQPGQTAHLRVMPLHLAQYRHPHDTAAGAQAIGSLPFSDQTETLTATSVSEPSDCYFNTNTVWYRFSPALPTPVVAHTVGSDFDTMIAVFRQDGDSLTALACNDDASPWGYAGTESLVRFVAEPGRTYLFQVGGYDGQSGNLSFAVGGVAP